MEFCDECGSMLMSSTCGKCGHKRGGKVELEIKEVCERDDRGVVVCGEKSESVNPVTDWDCHACGGKKAEFWLRQMRSGDEPESQFFKCVKCGKTVRVG
jgi:DNA-directed RNA polymerase subunit M